MLALEDPKALLVEDNTFTAAETFILNGGNENERNRNEIKEQKRYVKMK